MTTNYGLESFEPDPVAPGGTVVSNPAALAPTAPRRRCYDDGCAAAHALDLIGERWALLVVRELLLGPRRFTDLRHALRNISPNVLTQRLTGLEACGIVEHTQLSPPAACRVYGLTPWGMQLEPILMELLKWGVRSPAFLRGSPLTADAMVLSFKAMFDPALADGLACRIALIMGRETYYAAIEDGRLSVFRGTPPCSMAEITQWPAVTLWARPVTVLHLAYGKQPLAAAEAAGDCRHEGDTSALQKFLACFRVPAPVSA